MKILCAVLACALFSGCATHTDTVRSGEQVQREQAVRAGVVEAVREVQIEAARSTGAGGAIGAIVGGVVGSYAGSGRGSIVGSVIGAVVGGMAGQSAEQVTAREPGVELSIRLDEGRTIVIAQPVAAELFRPGDRVRVISDGVTARVMRD